MIHKMVFTCFVMFLTGFYGFSNTDAASAVCDRD
jgi:hypothetical protein